MYYNTLHTYATRFARQFVEYIFFFALFLTPLDFILGFFFSYNLCAPFKKLFRLIHIFTCCVFIFLFHLLDFYIWLNFSWTIIDSGFSSALLFCFSRLRQFWLWNSCMWLALYIFSLWYKVSLIYSWHTHIHKNHFSKYAFLALKISNAISYIYMCVRAYVYNNMCSYVYVGKHKQKKSST